MSRAIALDNICLRHSNRWGHTEYSLRYHKDYLEQRTGLSPDSDQLQLLQKTFTLFQFDFLFNTGDGLVDWKNTGRVTDMGHASYTMDGRQAIYGLYREAGRRKVFSSRCFCLRRFHR